ncbi:hypothetical protein Tco_0093483 [Tanacetum coccineum]
MSDMTACLNDLSYIPPKNEQNKPTQGNIGETSNKPTQAKRNEFEELHVSANEELYPGCDYVTRLYFMAEFTYFKVKGNLTDSILNEMLEFFQNVIPSSKGYKLPQSYYAIKKTFKMIRLQYLYKSSHTTKEMSWHATGKCTEPSKMQHPVDGRACIQDQGPTSGIRANRGTLNKKNHKITNKHSPTILYKMSQLANDEFSQHLSVDEESNHEDASDTGKEEYDIWVMEMEHYLEYIGNDAWKVIQNGNSKKRISTGKDGVIRILLPVTTAEIQAVEKERKAKNILLMAFPKEHMRRFHGMDDAKEIWEAIRTRFGGNANLKKMQKAVFKQQFEAFTISSSEGSLPPAWSNLAMTMRTKPDVDILSIDDLYNNLRVFKQEIQGVPHPLSGDYTPTPQEEIDESLYVYGKKGPQEPEPSVSDDRSSECSTCQSNDSAGSIGTSSVHSVDSESEISSIPPEVYVSSPITTNEKGVSDPKSKEVEPSCVTHIKTPRQPIKDQETPKVNRKNWNAMMERELGEGYSFTKKKCFVCGSLSHLIKDCDYYEKKMAREAEFKKQRVFNTGNGVAKPVWTNANRVNHANKFVPRSVQLNAGRPNINSVRPNINTGRTNINSVRPNINTGRTNVNPVRPRVNTGSSNVNTVRSRQPVPNKTSNSFSPKRPQVTRINWRILKNSMGGSVTFGGSKGYISGKGKIRVGNLDFDSVSFVKELGHFNLFSISQICDKQHKVLFTETECLVVSSDFKMPDENQIL